MSGITVSEVVAEGERLNRELEDAVADNMFKAADRLRGAILDYHENFGPCLLAVARAAVDMRGKLSVRYFDDADGGQDHQWVLHEGLAEALAAFDAVVWGEP